MHGFHTSSPEIKYVQYDENTCVLSHLDSDLFAVNEHVAEHAFVSRLSSYLSCDTMGFMNRIKFASDILTYHVRNTG